jgi:peptide/nickel transport system substrate-binding protein
MLRPISVIAVVLVSLLAACAPGAPGSTGDGANARGDSAAHSARTLVMVARVEPASATGRFDMSGGVEQDIMTRLFTAGLAYVDDRGVPRPYLAEALPQLGTETWQVQPDGHMETIYRLRPDLAWHDGTPLTADDFVFALRVFNDPDVGTLFKPTPQNLIEAVLAPDPRTVVFRWRSLVPDAGILDSGKSGFTPMPRHLLEAALDRDPAAVAASAYWSREFVGAGPYRLTRWEPSAFMEGAAFDRHALGNPRIERIKVVWIGDPNTTLATLLAGEADFAADSSLDFQQAEVLQERWAADGKGVVLRNSREVRYVQIQARPQFANPTALLNVRVRRAMAHATDTRALLEGMMNGTGIIADTIVSPDEEYFPTLDRVLTRYPFDPRRTEQLMLEAGLSKGPDGFYVSPAGPYRPEVRGPTEKELTILVDSWKQAGIDAQLSLTPPALASNNEYRAQFPAIAITKASLPDRIAVTKYATSNIATAENRWGGTNKGGYSNPAYDDLLERYTVALEREERNRLVIDMMKLASEELPSLPLYYDLTAVAYTSALQGPLRSAPEGLNFWNIHEWHWVS